MCGGGLVTGTGGTDSFSFEDMILDPLPPQSRNTAYGRAMLSLASFAGRALSATGLVLLIVTGAANLGATLLALLLHRAAPGSAILAFVILGLSWAFWLTLSFLRWRLNAAGPGQTVGEDWGLLPGEDGSPSNSHSNDAWSKGAASNGAGSASAFKQRATRDEYDETGKAAGSSEPRQPAEQTSMSSGRRADGTISVEAAERNARAQAEFEARRNTPFPRVEAAQRSIRVLVGGPEQPAWVRFDLRPLVISFVGVAVSFPVVVVTATITMIALLVATAPF